MVFKLYMYWCCKRGVERIFLWGGTRVTCLKTRAEYEKLMLKRSLMVLLVLQAEKNVPLPVPLSSEVIGVHACVGAFDGASFARDGSSIICLQASTYGRKA